jgi:hypothetical protein
MIDAGDDEGRMRPAAMRASGDSATRRHWPGMCARSGSKEVLAVVQEQQRQGRVPPVSARSSERSPAPRAFTR